MLSFVDGNDRRVLRIGLDVNEESDSILVVLDESDFSDGLEEEGGSVPDGHKESASSAEFESHPPDSGAFLRNALFRRWRDADGFLRRNYCTKKSPLEVCATQLLVQKLALTAEYIEVLYLTNAVGKMGTFRLRDDLYSRRYSQNELVLAYLSGKLTVGYFDADLRKAEISELLVPEDSPDDNVNNSSESLSSLKFRLVSPEDAMEVSEVCTGFAPPIR